MPHTSRVVMRVYFLYKYRSVVTATIYHGAADPAVSVEFPNEFVQYAMTTVAGLKSVSLSIWCYEARATLGREVGGAEQKSFPPDFGNGLGAHRLGICKPMHHPPASIHRTKAGLTW